MSNLKLHASSTLDGGATDATTSESYEVDTTRLTGHFWVATTTDLAVHADAGAQDPFTGQLTITGASGSKLVITVVGDETSTPATGEGQVELEVNGGAAIWTTWADLAASASTSAM